MVTVGLAPVGEVGEVGEGEVGAVGEVGEGEVGEGAVGEGEVGEGEGEVGEGEGEGEGAGLSQPGIVVVFTLDTCFSAKLAALATAGSAAEANLDVAETA